MFTPVNPLDCTLRPRAWSKYAEVRLSYRRALTLAPSSGFELVPSSLIRSERPLGDKLGRNGSSSRGSSRWERGSVCQRMKIATATTACSLLLSPDPLGPIGIKAAGHKQLLLAESSQREPQGRRQKPATRRQVGAGITRASARTACGRQQPSGTAAASGHRRSRRSDPSVGARAHLWPTPPGHEETIVGIASRRSFHFARARLRSSSRKNPSPQSRARGLELQHLTASRGHLAVGRNGCRTGNHGGCALERCR